MQLPHWCQTKRFYFATAIFLSLVILRILFSPDDTPATTSPSALLKVTVREQKAVKAHREITFTGKTEPIRRVSVHTETSGLVEKIHVDRGAYIKEGAPIATIEMQEREQKLAEAEALVKQRDIEYKAALELHEKDLTSDSQLAAAFTALQSAMSIRDSAILEVKHTQIVAPFSGFIEKRDIEIGSNLIANNFSRSESVAQIIDVDPLLITGSINEQNINYIEKGMPAFAKLATGEDITGHVHFISPSADNASRTFKIEIAFPNPDFSIPVGITAYVTIPTEEVWTHPISPDLLSLNHDGAFGLKAIDENNRVIFYPAEWVKSSQETIWLTGLPKTIQLITVGQGFAQEGEEIIPISENAIGSKESKPTQQKTL